MHDEGTASSGTHQVSCMVGVQVLGGRPLAGVVLPAAPQVAAQDAGEDQEQVGRPQGSQNHAHNLQQARLHAAEISAPDHSRPGRRSTKGHVGLPGTSLELTSSWAKSCRHSATYTVSKGGLWREERCRWRERCFCRHCTAAQLTCQCCFRHRVSADKQDRSTTNIMHPGINQMLASPTTQQMTTSNQKILESWEMRTLSMQLLDTIKQPDADAAEAAWFGWVLVLQEAMWVRRPRCCLASTKLHAVQLQPTAWRLQCIRYTEHVDLLPTMGSCGSNALSICRSQRPCRSTTFSA